MDLSHWMEPASQSRPALVLSVLSEDSPEAVREAVAEAARSGFGSVILRAKAAVSSERFSAQVAAAVETAGEGLSVYLAGLSVAAEESADITTCRLNIERCLNPADAAVQAERADVLGVYCLSLREGQTINGLEVWSPEAQPPDSSELLVAVSVAPAAPFAQLSGGDLLDRETTRRLIERTLEPLRQGMGEGAFGEKIAGILVDLPATSGGSAPWMADFPALYRDRWDEDIVPSLPLIWFDGPGAARFRWRFRSLVAELFRANFLEPLAEWNSEAGSQLALRVVGDGSLVSEVLHGMGPAIRFVDVAHVAGLTGASADSPYELSAAASSTRQKAKGGMLGEVFAGLGRQNTFGTYRAAADRAFVSEAALPAPGLAPMSLRGDRKREAGAVALVAAQPWWSHVDRLSADWGRLGDLLGQGSRQATVLILSPADSVMALANNPLPDTMSGIAGRKSINPKAQEIEEQFDQTLRAMQAYQISFDIGDEDLIARSGKVQSNNFIVGEAEYTAVVVPPALSWRSDTIRKLNRFARKGGSVIIARPIAPLVDFEKNSAIEDMADAFGNVYLAERPGRAVCAWLNRVEPQPIQIKTSIEQSSDDLCVHHRKTDSHDLFFVVNTSAERDVEARVILFADGAVRHLDPWTPRISLIYPEDEKGGQAFPFTFHAGASYLFSVGGDSDLTETPWQRLPRPTTSEPLADEWDFLREDPNFLPLTMCRLTVVGSQSQAQPVGFARIHLQERFRAAQAAEGETLPQVSLSFEFESRIDGFGRSVTVVVEPNPGLEVFCNGQPLTEETEEWLLDSSFRRLDVSALLRKGGNQIEMRFPYGPDAVVEAPILAGDFAVHLDERSRPVLDVEPETLRSGSWTEQGYPFYAGRMRYAQSVDVAMEEDKRYILSLKNPVGSVCSVQVGSQEPALLPFRPWRLDLTRLGRRGANAIEIEVAGTLYNLYGPLNLVDKLRNDPKASPAIHDAIPYRDRRLWSNRPTLLPFGMMGGAALETYDPHAPVPVEKKVAKREAAEEADGLAVEEKPEESEEVVAVGDASEPEDVGAAEADEAAEEPAGDAEGADEE